MKKDFLDELIDALTTLRDQQKSITIPAPPSPAAVLKTVGMVAKNHEVTAEDMEIALAMRNSLHGDSSHVTANEIQVIQELKQTK